MDTVGVYSMATGLASLALRSSGNDKSLENLDNNTIAKIIYETGPARWPESYGVIEYPTMLFSFEANHPHYSVVEWLIRNRHNSIVLGVIYVFLLYFGRRFMSNRQPFQLRRLLAAWNLFMALFSIAMAARLMPYFLKRTFYLSLQSQVCHKEYRLSPVIGLWGDLFGITKPIEFIDTLFIVLRKQQLHFLHWYHHITVVMLCWYSLGAYPSPSNCLAYAAMNSFIHSVMYTYYFLRSTRISVPRYLQMSITGMQILQMIVGFCFNIAALVYQLSGSKCDTLYESTLFAISIYFSYLCLFCKFFYNTYLDRKATKVH